MPEAVEAIYYTAGLSAAAVEAVQRTHSSFLQRYQLDAAANPLLVLNRSNWDSPFRAHSSRRK